MKLKKITIKKARNDGIFIIGFILLLLLSVFSSAQEGAYFSNVWIPILLIFVESFINSKGNLKIKLSSFWVLLFWLTASISTLINAGTFSTNIISLLIFSMLYIALSQYHYTEHSIKLILEAYVIISVISSAIVIISSILRKPFSGNYYARYSFDAIGLIKNPNYVTGFILFGFALLVFSLMNGKKRSKFKSVLIITSIFMCVLAFLLSGTRAAIVGAILVGAILIINYANLKKYGIALVILITILLLFIPNILDKLLLQGSLDRFAVSSLLSDSSRIDLWNLGFEQFKKGHIIFGLGLEGSNEVVITSKGHYLHNIILQILLDFGIVGFVFFVLVFIDDILKLKSKDRKVINILCIALFFPMLFQNGVSAMPLWLPLILRTVMIAYSKTSDGNLFDTLTSI